MALPTRRWLSMVSRLTYFARANAAATACSSPDSILEREIAGHIGVKLRRARRNRGIEARDGGQIAVFDFDQLARVLRDRRGFRDDHRDRLADKTHAAHREHRIVAA